MSENYINHICLVLDASTSMRPHTAQVIKVADGQIAYLAQRSKELNQETRISVYSFSSGPATCLVYDKDVLRMPSIADIYRPGGLTALVDAAILAIDDLGLTPEKYGEHSFLIYVLTDGQENCSISRPATLSGKITALPDHWTLATFVPNAVAIHEAKKFGFLPNNIAVWDATTVQGISEAGTKLREATEQFMVNRERGIRGTRSLFELKTVSVADVEQALKTATGVVLDVAADGRIDDFISGMFHRPYHVGEAYYQLTKTETIQPQKSIAIKVGDKVYIGPEARNLLGLPSTSVRVKPENYPYKIFVQSTSVNRKLIAGTQLLVPGR